MAHIGNFYPVLFRRDFNLNVNTNRIGWPRRWILTFGQASFLSFSTWDLGPDIQSALASISWLSIKRTLGPFGWQVEFRVTIRPGGATYLLEWFVYDAATGATVASWKNNRTDLDVPSTGSRDDVVLVSENPVYFPSGLAIGSVRTERKVWGDGPPH